MEDSREYDSGVRPQTVIFDSDPEPEPDPDPDPWLFCVRVLRLVARRGRVWLPVRPLARPMVLVLVLAPELALELLESVCVFEGRGRVGCGACTRTCVRVCIVRPPAHVGP